MGRLHEIVVAADGTVLAIKRGTDDVQLVAVNPSGAQAWTHTFTTGIHRFELAGELVLIATGNAPRDWRERPPQSPRTGLIALNLSNGSQAWSLDIDGMVSAIEPAANAIFAVVTDPPDDGGAGQRRQGTRKLMALSRSGAILWTFPLN
jgi:outer membrane protein assembly factor BamB